MAVEKEVAGGRFIGCSLLYDEQTRRLRAAGLGYDTNSVRSFAYASGWLSYYDLLRSPLIFSFWAEA